MFTNNKKIIKGLRNKQKETFSKNPDEYEIGLYNGLELALSVLEGREPVFETVTKEPEIIEKKEEGQKGRTIASGIIRRC